MCRNIRCNIFFCVYGIYGVETKQAYVSLCKADPPVPASPLHFRPWATHFKKKTIANGHLLIFLIWMRTRLFEYTPRNHFRYIPWYHIWRILNVAHDHLLIFLIWVSTCMFEYTSRNQFRYTPWYRIWRIFFLNIHCGTFFNKHVVPHMNNPWTTLWTHINDLSSLTLIEVHACTTGTINIHAT